MSSHDEARSEALERLETSVQAGVPRAEVPVPAVAVGPPWRFVVAALGTVVVLFGVALLALILVLGDVRSDGDNRTEQLERLEVQVKGLTEQLQDRDAVIVLLVEALREAGVDPAEVLREAGLNLPPAAFTPSPSATPTPSPSPGPVSAPAPSADEPAGEDTGRPVAAPRASPRPSSSSPPASSPPPSSEPQPLLPVGAVLCAATGICLERPAS